MRYKVGVKSAQGWRYYYVAPPTLIRMVRLWLQTAERITITKEDKPYEWQSHFRAI